MPFDYRFSAYIDCDDVEIVKQTESEIQVQFTFENANEFHSKMLKPHFKTMYDVKPQVSLLNPLGISGIMKSMELDCESPEFNGYEDVSQLLHELTYDVLANMWEFFAKFYAHKNLLTFTIVDIFRYRTYLDDKDALTVNRYKNVLDWYENRCNYFCQKAYLRAGSVINKNIRLIIVLKSTELVSDD